MRMASISIPVRLAIEECEPTGAMCSACGEAIFLREHQLFAVIGEGRNASKGDADVRLCSSCAEIAAETIA